MYDTTPRPSHPNKILTKLSVKTIRHMLKINSKINRVNRFLKLSLAIYPALNNSTEEEIARMNLPNIRPIQSINTVTTRSMLARE